MKRRHQPLETRPTESKETQVQYEVTQSPKWYCRRDYVLDRMFGVEKSRYVEVAYPEGSDSPNTEIDKFTVHYAIPPSEYFPPANAVYSTDYYLLVEGKKLIFPKGFPPKPETLELANENGLGPEAVIRGIKYRVDYPLTPATRTRKEWINHLKQKSPLDLAQAVHDHEVGASFLPIVEEIENLTGVSFSNDTLRQAIYGSKKETIGHAERILTKLETNWEQLEGKRVLDVGSEYAFLAYGAYLQRIDTEIVSLDIDAPLHAWALLPEEVKDRCVQGDAFNMPFDTQTFDIILSHASVDLNEIPNIKRFLKPSGQILSN